MALKVKFIFLGALCAVVIAVLLIRFSGTTAERNSTLIIGTAAGYAPFVSINVHGEYEGFDIDVAHAIAKDMGVKLVLKDLGSMTSLFMALEQGSIDAIIWGLSITQERLKRVTMIQYQGEVVRSYPLMFWDMIPTGITTINDMQDMTVCVEPASSQDVVLSKYPFIFKQPTERVDDALLAIQYGKAVAAFVEPAIAKKFAKKYPNIQILDVPLAQEDQVLGNGIAIKTDRIELARSIAASVERLRTDGTIHALEQKWDIA
jgi:ABC-type amino acid transport substrate-binding protein